jgi:hypothetical protein
MREQDGQENGRASAYEAALARFSVALEQLERTAAARIENDLANADIEEELAIMQDDRARIARDLDAALTRAATLEKTRDEVLRRLETAGAGGAAALSRQDG